MSDFASNILNAVRTDAEFKYNPVLMAVVENLESKRSSHTSEESYLKTIRESLSSANNYIKNQRIEKMLVSIDEKLGSELVTNMHTKINSMYYEVEFPAAIKAIRESRAYAEPVVKNYIDHALMEMQSKTIPYFKYLPGFLGTMTTYATNEVVNEWVTKFNNYITENGKKLMLLETVHYLDGTGNGFYNGVTNKIKPFILANEYGSAKIMFEMKEFKTIPVIGQMIATLQSQEATQLQQFTLGTGDVNTKVYNYIGPVLKENNSMVLFADGAFINLTSEAVEESAIAKTYGKSGDINVQELKAEYVYEKMQSYYQVAKSFEFLNFNVKEKGLSSKLRNIKIDFKINESENLDLYINESIVVDPKEINFHQMFVLENNYVKNCSTTVFNNMDKIYNVEFAKLLINESRNVAAMIINVNEEYYVYDFIDSKKRDIFKTDGFALQKFVFEKFGYDVRSLFKLQIDDVKSKVDAIEEKKSGVLAAIAELEESEKLVSTTMSKSGLKSDDMESLRGLSEKIEKELVALKNSYILLEDERTQVVNPGKQTQETQELKIGDNVDFDVDGVQGTGRIVAQDDDSSMVFTDQGRTQKVQREQMRPQSQPVHESQKSQDAQSQDTQSQQAQAQAQEAQQAQAQAQEAQQAQAQAQEAQQAQAQTQEAQSAQQGIVGQQTEETQAQQAQEAQDTEKTAAGFKKITATLGELRSAIDTVRPEVKDKFHPLTDDMDTLIKQAGELERIQDEMSEVKSVSDKSDFSKIEKKFSKIISDLDGLTSELRSEFGKGAQQVQLSESLMQAAYDKYVNIVAAVADKLIAKVSTIVKKLSGEIIDLDADVKVASARAHAAKAKDELSSTAPKGEIPVAGQSTQDSAAQNMQDTQPGQPMLAHQAQYASHQAQETHAQQAQEHQAQAQTQQEQDAQKIQESFDAQAQSAASSDYSNDKNQQYASLLNGMSDDELADEYLDVFSDVTSETRESIQTRITDDKDSVIQELLGVQETVMQDTAE